jgi:hypothetical protein
MTEPAVSALNAADVIAGVKRHIDEYKGGGSDREAEDLALCREIGLPTDGVVELWANSRREKAAAAETRLAEVERLKANAFAEMRKRRDKGLADYQAREPEEDGQAVLKRLLGMGAALEPEEPAPEEEPEEETRAEAGGGASFAGEQPSSSKEAPVLSPAGPYDAAKEYVRRNCARYEEG